MADFHGTQEVVTDLREDGVLIMRINRPEKRNAINAVTSAAMEDIMNKAEKDKRVRVIVVTGTGEKAFCAGEDLSELSSGGECMTVTDHGFGGITDRLCPKRRSAPSTALLPAAAWRSPSPATSSWLPSMPASA